MASLYSLQNNFYSNRCLHSGVADSPILARNPTYLPTNGLRAYNPILCGHITPEVTRMSNKIWRVVAKGRHVGVSF